MIRDLTSRILAACLSMACLVACASVAPDRPGEKTPPGVEDPLSAWSDTAVKRVILDFVAEVTRPGGSGYVPPEDRLATLDFDGTIGCEKPDFMEVMVAIRRLCELTEADPALLDQKLYRAACDEDLETINADVEDALLTAFLGEAQSFYVAYVEEFIRTRHHPRFDRPYAQLYYLPMRQLFDLLRARDFAVYVVSGSQQGFTRGYGTDVLGFAAPRLIGRTVSLDFSFDAGVSTLPRQDSFLSPNPGGKGKAEIIRNRIGRQPILAFGNSMGDFEMLQYATSNRYPSLGLILVHDDPEEYVYSDQELIQNAESLGWQRVSMKDDFEAIFPQG